MAVNNEGVMCEPRADCVLCGASGDMLYEGLRDVDFDAPGEWAIRRCGAGGCGLAWSDPQPWPDEIIKLYQRYYTHGGEGAEADEAQPSFASGGKAKLVKAVLAALVPWRRRAFRTDHYYLQGMPPGRVLDIGCGSGLFLAAMARAG